MKKRFIAVFIFVILLVPIGRVYAQDAITEIIREAVIKVIKAVDLKIQRLQTKTVWLQNAQKAIENTMSKLKLDEITNWVEKQRKLYEDYFNELWKVKDVISYYHKIKEMTDEQLAILKEYKRGMKGTGGDAHFTAQEVSYMAGIYLNILNESIKNLDQISLVLESFATQMSDAARMKIIDAAAASIQKNYQDIKTFTSQNVQLSLARAHNEGEIQVVKQLYGIE